MHWRRLRPCPSPCNPAYEIGHCEGAPNHTVPYGTVLSKDAFPGTSCQATIAVSLRDARAAISQQPLTIAPVMSAEGARRLRGWAEVRWPPDPRCYPGLQEQLVGDVFPGGATVLSPRL